MNHPYETLVPDLVIDAIESMGLISDQRIFPLNSYENRVYQIGIEDQAPIIAKFYRPQRWSREAILEEHAFSLDLQNHDINIVTPTTINGTTLHEFGGFNFALFPRQGGYAPEVEVPDTLFRIGRNIGKMHALGATQTFKHRPSFSIERLGIESREFLLQSSHVPASLTEAYSTLTADLIQHMQQTWDNAPLNPIRLHGDCHLSNILWREEKAYFVDFDDCVNGPAIQDIWLLLSGDRSQQTLQLSEFVEGYEEFYEFDHRQLTLIETLRTLRMMNYAAWLARRWNDPAFPMHFPWFNTERYWSEHILELREQFSALQEPALKLIP